ncbi:hypothetical protein [Myceligenerans salitolerans]|uniref:Uncharacterized protein n=1 Tax=Myceligenerans salitolerans TaxID=1230528 RepID=A0ABS3I844_9MICO|nr:hypothetical protein [Myceligenerans salitolerans]MBO0609110.1 hypothetical protein [Myceligenerans salitolerans]
MARTPAQRSLGPLVVPALAVRLWVGVAVMGALFPYVVLHGPRHGAGRVEAPHAAEA